MTPGPAAISASSHKPIPKYSDTGQARTVHLTTKFTDSPIPNPLTSLRTSARRTPVKSLSTNTNFSALRHCAEVHEQAEGPEMEPQSYLSIEQIKQSVIELKNINFIPRYLLEYFQRPKPPQVSETTQEAEPQVENTDTNSNKVLDPYHVLNQEPEPEPEREPEPETPVSRRDRTAWAGRTSSSFSDTENNNEEVQHGRYNRNYLYKFHNFNQNSLVYSLRGSLSSFDDSMSEDRVIFTSTSAARPLGRFNPPRFANPPSYSHNSPVLYPLPPSLYPPFYPRKCNPSLCRPLVFK